MTIESLPLKFEAVSDFLMFQPGIIKNVKVMGGRFSDSGIVFSCPEADQFNHQEITVKFLYNYGNKQFLAFQKLENGDFIIWNEKKFA